MYKYKKYIYYKYRSIIKELCDKLVYLYKITRKTGKLKNLKRKIEFISFFL